MDIFKEISNKHNLNINEFIKPEESYNSLVRIGNGNNRFYVIKILLNQKKRDNEKKYYEYLKDKVDVPLVLASSIIDDKPYNIISYIDGENLSDLKINDKSSEIIYSLGVILGKLHNTSLLEGNEEEWINYINNYLVRSFKSLDDYLSDNLELYLYLKEKFDIYQKNLDLVNAHLDFRPGNIIYNDKPNIIDLESMRCGDSAFDFVKMSRLLNDDKFKIFLDGYSSVRNLPNDFLDKLKFYRLFDAYTSINWCILHDAISSEYYERNMNAIKKEFRR